MALAPVSAAAPASAPLGLDFRSLLKIILTQLTYQDPLKPMDNFQFVSQLAQFTQIQQGQVMSNDLSQLVNGQSAGMAANLLGKTVDVAAAQGGTTLTGTVQAISLQNGT